MDCGVISGYTRNCRDSIGGIRTVFFVESSAKNNLVTSSGNVTTFTLNPGKMFYKYDLEMATGTASDDPQPNSGNGTFYFDHKLNIRIPKRSASFSYQLKNLGVNDLMAIILDNNGDYWLAGASDLPQGNNGLKLQPSTSPFGTALADLNGYELVFAGMEPHAFLKVPQNLIATLTTPA